MNISIQEFNNLSNSEKAIITYNDLKERKVKREKEKERIMLGYYGYKKIVRESDKSSKCRQTYKKRFTVDN